MYIFCNQSSKRLEKLAEANRQRIVLEAQALAEAIQLKVSTKLM